MQHRARDAARVTCRRAQATVRCSSSARICIVHPDDASVVWLCAGARLNDGSSSRRPRAQDVENGSTKPLRSRRDRRRDGTTARASVAVVRHSIQQPYGHLRARRGPPPPRAACAPPHESAGALRGRERAAAEGARTAAVAVLSCSCDAARSRSPLRSLRRAQALPPAARALTPPPRFARWLPHAAGVTRPLARAPACAGARGKAHAAVLFVRLTPARANGVCDGGRATGACAHARGGRAQPRLLAKGLRRQRCGAAGRLARAQFRRATRRARELPPSVVWHWRWSHRRLSPTAPGRAASGPPCALRRGLARPRPSRPRRARRAARRPPGPGRSLSISSLIKDKADDFVAAAQAGRALCALAAARDAPGVRSRYLRDMGTKDA
jgi:hypothetical protein